MGICKIRISNFKSIKRIDINIIQNGINCLLGKNGAGKTTIMKAIQYFYKVADNPYEAENIFDKKNPYIQKAFIELRFDFSRLEKKSRNIFVDENIATFEKYIKDNILPVKLTQHKSGKLEWWPVNDAGKVRRLLKVFPVFAIQAKEVTADDWSQLWDVVSSIAISGMKENRDNIQQCLENNFSQIYGDKYAKSLKIIQKVLKEENIGLNEHDYKARFKNAILTNLGGEIFTLEEQNIDYYSSGINSLKFISLFVKLASELSNTAWKDVTMLIDEPEISLHPQFIEKLADTISDCNEIQYLIASHSAYFVSALVRDSKTSFYQVYQKREYTDIRKIEDIILDEEKYLLGENEAGAYFANGIVFVEGQTEIQLLKNKRLAKLFPELKKITVYNTKSNNSATRLMMPKSEHPAIPYLILVDMDKILCFNKQNQKFEIQEKNKDVNPLGNREKEEKEKKLYYNRRKKETCIRRRKIKELLENTKFKVDENNFYLTGIEYEEIIREIKRYCEMYRTLPMKTTIEGAVICKESYSVFLEWLTQSEYISNIDKLKKTLAGYNEISAKVGIIRCIFHGKLDSLLKLETEKKDPLSNKKTKVKNVNQDVYATITGNMSGKKTDGWILDFFNWYFDKYTTDSQVKDQMRFQNTFPEIYEIVKYIRGML